MFDVSSDTAVGDAVDSVVVVAGDDDDDDGSEGDANDEDRVDDVEEHIDALSNTRDHNRDVGSSFSSSKSKRGGIDKRPSNTTMKKPPWTSTEDAVLLRLVLLHGDKQAVTITHAFNEELNQQRTEGALMTRWRKTVSKMTRKKPGPRKKAGKSALKKEKRKAKPTRPKPAKYVYNGEAWNMEQDRLLAEIVVNRGGSVNWQKVTDLYNIAAKDRMGLRDRTLVAVYSRWRKRLRHDIQLYLTPGTDISNLETLSSSTLSTPKLKKKRVSTRKRKSEYNPDTSPKLSTKEHTHPTPPQHTPAQSSGTPSPPTSTSTRKRARTLPQETRPTPPHPHTNSPSPSHTHTHVEPCSPTFDWVRCNNCGDLVSGTTSTRATCDTCMTSKPNHPHATEKEARETADRLQRSAISILHGLKYDKHQDWKDDTIGVAPKFDIDHTHHHHHHLVIHHSLESQMQSRPTHSLTSSPTSASQQCRAPTTPKEATSSTPHSTTLPQATKDNETSTATATSKSASTSTNHVPRARVKRVLGSGVPLHTAMSVKFARSIVDSSIVDTYSSRQGTNTMCVQRSNILNRHGQKHRRSLYNDSCARCGSHTADTTPPIAS
eukprot:m.154096 g.154096  ORF g.154096 m.154096 type:complete len:603 (-) comp30868_c3_seq1:60-1868(-)